MSKVSVNYSGWQLAALVLLRLLIGWHFLYEGLFKLINPDWTSIGYLLDSQWILKGFFHALAANPSVLAIVDFLNMWGLILIGLGLMLGMFTRISCIAGIILLAFYYLSHPSFPGLEYTMPMEGNYLIIDKTLIEIFTIWVLLIFPTGRIMGVDRILFGRK